MDKDVREACYWFPNTGYLLKELDKEALAPIWEEVNEIRSDWSKARPHNYGLAGSIRKEYTLTKCKDYVEKLVLPYIALYDQGFNYSRGINLLSAPAPLVIDDNDLWVNFQEKHEFNPPHNHSGIMSFVIWLQIPYFLVHEALEGPGSESNSPVNGDFAFQYTNSLGQIQAQRLGADRSKENHLVLFPAQMNHAVYPFYSSNDYRITVAGNFRFKNG